MVAGPGVTVVMSGGHPAELAQRLAELDPRPFGDVVSFGLAGALDPGLRAGDLIVPEGVALVSPSNLPPAEMTTESGPGRTRSQGASFEASLRGAPRDEEGALLRYRCSPGAFDALRSAAARLRIAVASRGAILGSDAPVLTADAKRGLRAATGADAVDMESHVAAAFADRHGLPFGVLRVISDAADSAIPPAALAAMRRDGGIDAFAALRSILRQPGQIPALIGTARDGAKAFGILDRLAPALNTRP